MKGYSIGQLASEFGLTTRTLRFWEGKGLLAPQRVGFPQTLRIYSDSDRTNVMTILEAKRLGYELDDIKALKQDDGRLIIPLAIIRQQRDALIEKRDRITHSITQLYELEAEHLDQLA